MYELLCKPRPWHGAPIAAFKRAFVALGSVRIERLSEEAIGDLQLLRDLYFRLPEDFNVASITPAPSVDRRPDQRPGASGMTKIRDIPAENPPKSVGGLGLGGLGLGRPGKKASRWSRCLFRIPSGPLVRIQRAQSAWRDSGPVLRRDLELLPDELNLHGEIWSLSCEEIWSCCLTSSICMERFGACLAKRSGAVA